MGGNARLGYTLINQRAEEVNKAVLELCDNLFLHRQKGRNSLTALSKWLDIGAVKESKTIINSLSTLPTGECWAWMAGSETPELIKVQEKNSLHPDRRIMRDAKAAKIKSAVDVGAFVQDLRKNLVAIEAELDANDPAKLKAKIRELEKHGARAPEPDPKAIQRAHEQGVASGYELAWADFQAALEPALANLAGRVAKELATIKLTRPKRGPQKAIPAPYVAMKTVAAAPAEPRPATPSGDLSRPEQRIVDSLAFWLGIGKETPTRQQVAAVAGYSPKSGAYNNLLGQLNGKGIISYPAPGILSLTAGAAANVMDADTAKQKLLDSLTAPERKVLAAFNSHVASRDEIAERSGYSPSSGGFNNLLGSLAGIGVIVRPAPGMVDLADWAREIL